MNVISKLMGALLLLAIIGLPIVLRTIKRSTKTQGPLIIGSTVEFPIVSGMRLLIRLVLVLLSAFCVLVFVASLSPGGSVFVVLIPLSVLVAIILAIPRPVVIDSEGIRQGRVLLQEHRTTWNEVSSVARDEQTGRTVVRSKDGNVAAVFSPVLAGRQRFEEEIRVRAKNVVFETRED